MAYQYIRYEVRAKTDNFVSSDFISSDFISNDFITVTEANA